jgi:hypothetical protein
MRQPDRPRPESGRPQDLPWWARPCAVNLLFVLPVLLAVIWAGDSGFGASEARARSYLSAPYVSLFMGLLLVSAAGAWLGENVHQRSVPQSPDPALLRAAVWMGVLVLATYMFWYRSLIWNPALVISSFTGVGKPDRSDIGTVTGITSLVNVAPAFFSLAGYLLFVRKARDRALVALTVVLLLFTFLRVQVWSERLAAAEAIIPLALALLAAAPQPRQRMRRLLYRLGPYAALPAVFLFFAVSEFFRSWPFYKDRMEFWEFATGRFANYYYTSLNNGAGMLATTDWPTGTFEGVLYWLHAFPLGIGPWFSEVIGLRTSIGEIFLQRYGDPEFNTGSAFAVVTLELGVAGAVLYFFLSMFCAGLLYTRYVRRDPLALMLYPSVLVAIYESFRFPYWGTSRAFVWLLGTVAVLLVLWICGAIGAAGTSSHTSGSRPA